MADILFPAMATQRSPQKQKTSSCYSHIACCSLSDANSHFNARFTDKIIQLAM